MRPGKRERKQRKGIKARRTAIDRERAQAGPNGMFYANLGSNPKAVMQREKSGLMSVTVAKGIRDTVPVRRTRHRRKPLMQAVWNGDGFDYVPLTEPVAADRMDRAIRQTEAKWGAVKRPKALRK